MLHISSLVGEEYRKIYAIILWIAIFTTALSNGFGFINRFSNKYKRKVALIFCLSSIPVAKIGFANLVSIIYPIFGFIGVIIMFFLLYSLK